MIIEIFNREKIEMNGQVRGIGDKFGLGIDMLLYVDGINVYIFIVINVVILIFGYVNYVRYI